MRVAHISDLHLGKEMDSFDLLPYQRSLLTKRVLPLLEDVRPQVLVITGDVFESLYPDDVCLSAYDDFLFSAFSICKNIIILSGNHDNPTLIEYLSRILSKNGIYSFGKNRSYLPKVVLEDDYGPISFYALPFLQSRFLTSFDHPLYREGATAVAKRLISNTKIDEKCRNVLLGHQYIFSSQDHCETSVDLGPQLDMIDSSVLGIFDHVCFGHIHEAKCIGKNIVYSGAPYPMHYGDKNEKYIEVLELGQKGVCHSDLIPIPNEELRISIYRTSITDFRKLPMNNKDFVYVHLDSEFIPYEVAQELQLKYPHFCRCLSKNAGQIPSFSSKSYSERNLEGFDTSWVARQIGKEELINEEGIFIEKLTTKLKKGT